MGKSFVFIPIVAWSESVHTVGKVTTQRHSDQMWSIVNSAPTDRQL